MRVHKATNLAWTETAHHGFAVALVPDGPMWVLEGSSAVIWDYIAGEPDGFTAAEFAKSLAAKMSDDDSICERIESETVTFLSELVSRGLLVRDQGE